MNQNTRESALVKTNGHASSIAPAGSLRCFRVVASAADDDARAEAKRLRRWGLHVVAITPGGKAPIGKNWGVGLRSDEEIDRVFNANTGAGVGILLGPGKAPDGGWLIDIEGDGPEAEESFIKLCVGEIHETTGWPSRRGNHRLFIADDVFIAALQAAGGGSGSGVVKLPECPGLEFRIGGLGKQLQSVCPPTPGEDGVPRAWNGCETIATTIDAMVGSLESIAERRAIQGEGASAVPAVPSLSVFKATATKALPLNPEGDPTRYAATALEAECGNVAAAPEGSRNEALNKAAYNMGQLVGAGAIAADVVIGRLTEAARSAGLGEAETAATLKSGLTKGMENPRTIPPLRANGGGAGVATVLQGNPAVALKQGKGEIDYRALTLDELGFIGIEDVVEKPIDWLWPYRLARGEMALMAGEGGLGKSQLLLWIAAAVSNGWEWIDKSGFAPVGRTIIVAAEDDPGSTIKPRLRAMGADRSRVGILKAKVRIEQPGRPPLIDPKSLQDLDYWNAFLDRFPDVVLLVVDPLPSYLGRGVNDSKNGELRSVLEPFIDEVVRPRGICFLANTHLNKSIDTRSAVNRINGSVAYANTARNTHFIIRDPDDPSRRFFKQAKCNNAPDDLKAIGFRIEKRIIPSDAGDIETAIPVFDEEGTDIDLSDAMAGEKRPAKRRGPAPEKTAEHATWLYDYLKSEGRPVQQAVIIDAMDEAFPGCFGEKLPNGRWAGIRAFYRVVEFIPKLEPERDGCKLDSFKVGNRTFCQLVNAEPAF